MKLRSGMPFWLIKDGLPYNYPKLDKNISTDVVIVGAGISGALVRYYLLRAGINCIMLDARTIGLGSTSASTSLLQYEIDVPLHQLINIAGKANAERAYQLCSEAIDTLSDIAKKLKFDEFAYKKSLYYAAYKKDVPFLKKEFAARKEAGFALRFLDHAALKKEFGIDAPAAILSEQGAQTNAYSFTHSLLQYKKGPSLNIYDRSPVVHIETTKQGVTLKTESGNTVKAKKIVYATGYEIVELFEDHIVDLKSTYAAISEQYNERKFWHDEVLIWNTANPYLYMRCTPDGRVLVGGRDEDFNNDHKRDKLLARKTKQLSADCNKLFPGLEFRPEFSWAGTFGSTKDGLPYIGMKAGLPNSYFALGFGGNGITFSVIAAQIITDMIQKKQNRDAALFAFDRHKEK